MKIFIWAIIIVALLGGGYYFFKDSTTPYIPEYTDLETSTSTPTTATSTNSGIVAMFTLADVSVHNNQKDCWSAINGNVYNLTTWISQHPGGEQAILSICGKDGTTAFNGQHGGMAKQASILATFFIGTLK